MEYNTTRGKLIIPEYGRNVQKMVQHCLTIEDREERNICAKSIVKLMGQLNNQFKDTDDFQNTLWTHLYIIADFKLDVDSPYEIPKIEELKTSPKKVEYPSSKVKYRHYGKSLEAMVDKIKDYEEGEEKDYYVKNLAELMKRSYMKWNRDNVKDEIIFRQLLEISDNKITIPEGLVLNVKLDSEDIAVSSNNKKRKSNNNNYSNKKKKRK